MFVTITSKNVTHYTRNFALVATNSRAPDPKDLVQNLRLKFETIINTSDPSRKDHRIKIAQAKSKLEKLDHLLQNLPNDMELATVLYSKPKSGKSKTAMNEFSHRVKPQFFKFLAKNYSSDLKRMGICDHGIKKMTRGLAPTDDQGHFYNVSVDHIIERSGGGKMTLKRSVDPMLAKFSGDDRQETFEINHFKNLILLPDDVHTQAKNYLNTLQGLNDINYGDRPKWCVMLVPKLRSKTSPFIHVPRADKRKTYGVKKLPKTFSAVISHMNYELLQLDGISRDFLNCFFVQELKSSLTALAQQDGRTFSEILAYQKHSVANDNQQNQKVPIRKIFHDALVSYGPKLSVSRYKQVIDLTQEIEKNMRYSFNIAADRYKKTQSIEESEKLLRFLESDNFAHNLKRLKIIPDVEQGSARMILKDVERYKNALYKRINKVRSENGLPAFQAKRRSRRR